MRLSLGYIALYIFLIVLTQQHIFILAPWFASLFPSFIFWKGKYHSKNKDGDT